MKKSILFLSVMLITLSSCEKRIDGSSDSAMKSSIEEIENSLNDEKRDKFNESVTLILFNELDFGKLMKDGGADMTASDIKSKLDGKTADEIIAEGDKIKAAKEQKKKDQAKSEVAELYQKKEYTEQSKKMLEKFEVSRSRFYKRNSGDYFNTLEPIIELTVKNGLDKAISKAYFTGVLSSQGRSVPWLKKDFNYEIPGGIEPGEETTLYLAPNQFSEWGTVEAPKNAILTIEVMQLNGPVGEELFSAYNFDSDANERLEELLSDYPEFKK